MGFYYNNHHGTYGFVTKSAPVLTPKTHFKGIKTRFKNPHRTNCSTYSSYKNVLLLEHPPRHL